MTERDKLYENLLKKRNWESIQQEEIQSLYEITEDGLGEEEAAKRLEYFGENKLPEKKKKNKILLFLGHFNNALIYVLIVAAIVTGFMQHWVDMGVIIGVVVINAIIGYIQEDRAEKALDSIRNMVSNTATVVREGKKRELDTRELVPGDVVYLKAGDKVPADLRVIEASNLRVEEASLTGEAEEVVKYSDPVEEGADLGDRTSMIYMGTSVRNGSGSGVVVATGAATELGKINRLMSEVEETTTPLVQKINQFGVYLSVFIVAVSLAAFLFGYFFRGIPFDEMMLAIIGIAVASIPEGLPAVMTITLAIGVQKMAKRNAIVRKLPSVETLGSVSVICSDKTGTLTKNEMTVVALYTAQHGYKVEGSGYQPKGSILLDGKEVSLEEDQALLRGLEGAGYCNDAVVVRKDGDWHAVGAPTEAALKVLWMKSGKDEEEKGNRIAVLPFDSTYKYMATLNEVDGERFLYINGAPEKIIDLCKKQQGNEGAEALDEDYWKEKIEEGASLGQRMLATAYKKVENRKESLSHEDLEEGLILSGVFGLIDPPREEVVHAVKESKEAGITVKMITGDHALTAMSIGRELGVGDGQISITGSEIEKMSDEELQEKVKDCHIFARTTPEHKIRIVNALQANGHICAMTGDGVNDAPALKQAEMGIAMGIKGTEVSKDAADMVLADDNFASIVNAIEEGRTIYDNIKKTLLFMLPTNFAEGFAIIAAILMGTTLPISAVQILWVNMITAVTLSLAIAFENMEEHAMERPPRSPKEPIISKYFATRIGYVVVIVTFFTVASFQYYYEQGYGLEFSRTVAVNTLVACELFYLFNCRRIIEPALGKGFFENRITFMVVAILIFFQMLFTYVPVANVLFGTAPLTPEGWGLPVGAGILVFIVVEVEKWITSKVKKRRRNEG